MIGRSVRNIYKKSRDRIKVNIIVYLKLPKRIHKSFQRGGLQKNIDLVRRNVVEELLDDVRNKLDLVKPQFWS